MAILLSCYRECFQIFVLSISETQGAQEDTLLKKEVFVMVRRKTASRMRATSTCKKTGACRRSVLASYGIVIDDFLIQRVFWSMVYTKSARGSLKLFT